MVTLTNCTLISRAAHYHGICIHNLLYSAFGSWQRIWRVCRWSLSPIHRNVQEDQATGGTYCDEWQGWGWHGGGKGLQEPERQAWQLLLIHDLSQHWSKHAIARIVDHIQRSKLPPGLVCVLLRLWMMSGNGGMCMWRSRVDKSVNRLDEKGKQATTLCTWMINKWTNEWTNEQMNGWMMQELKGWVFQGSLELVVYVDVDVFSWNVLEGKLELLL